MKYRLAATAAILAVGGLAFAKAPEIDPERINSMVADVLRQADQNPHMTQKPDGAALRKEITMQLQTFEILKNEALKAGLDKDSEVQHRFKIMEARFYAEQYAQYLERTVEVSDSELHAFYDQQTRMIKLQQVRFASAAEAKAAQSLLLKGLSFDELMKRYPNPEQKFNEFIALKQLPADLANVTAGMVRGDVTREPVSIGGQFYLFKLSAVERDPQAQPFELVKSQIARQLKQQKVSQQIEALLKANGITPPH